MGRNIFGEDSKKIPESCFIGSESESITELKKIQEKPTSDDFDDIFGV